MRKRRKWHDQIVILDNVEAGARVDEEDKEGEKMKEIIVLLFFMIAIFIPLAGIFLMADWLTTERCQDFPIKEYQTGNIPMRCEGYWEEK